MNVRRSARPPRLRAGFALVTVIVVLAALLVLCTPFLISSTHADRASSDLFDRTRGRLALDNAAVHARTVLSRSHPGLDATRDWDSLEELFVGNEFPEGFLDARDPTGVLWDVESEDLAGRIDLDTAPPQVFANLLGLATRLVAPVTGEDTEFSLASPGFLPESGFVWIDGELVRFGSREGNKLGDLLRGVLAEEGEQGREAPGFRKASNHAVGTALLDYRAFAPVLWRFAGGDLRRFDSPERLREVAEFTLDGVGLGAAELARLAELGTVHVDGRSNRPWMRAMRLTRAVRAGEDGAITVDMPRFVNEGSTVRIRGRGTLEYALVQRVTRGGLVHLDRPLAFDHEAHAAVVEVLARRPVNVNTAPPEVLEVLFTNLQVRGRGDRITGIEAKALAGLVAASRPFTGLEDFLRRVVLPAGGISELPADAPVRPAVIDPLQGGGPLIDRWDAYALYANALNACDTRLSFSTMPFSFASRDVHRLDLRAAVHAPSGVERFSTVREEVRLVAPQLELFHAFGRQEDFDEALRLTSDAPYWSTGPAATARHDGLSPAPSSRFVAHFARDPAAPPDDRAPRPPHVFASREDSGWAQLVPDRIQEVDALRGRMLHFDQETRDPEGRYLPDEPLRLVSNDALVNWAGPRGLLRALGLSLWVKPRALGDASLLDVMGSSVDADRLSIFLEGPDLVVRLLESGGDHPQTVFREASEVRYALSAGNGPGLPADVWHHLALDVKGSRPDQLTLLVNGSLHGVRTPGLSRLSSGVAADAGFLPLESIEGFPPRGVARVGNELVEYELSGNGLAANFASTGVAAGFGGRNARVSWSGTQPAIPNNLATLDRAHPAGTSVSVYGYSLPVSSDVPAGASQLPGALGTFRCAVAIGVEGGSQTLGDPISVQTPFGTFQVGFGMEGSGSQVTGLLLAPAENPDGGGADPALMAAFSPQGGYAALVQVRWTAGQATTSAMNSPLGGIEILRYSGWSGNVLRIAARGQAVQLQNLQGWGLPAGGGSRAFVTNWQQTTTAAGDPIQPQLNWRTFVFPISVPVPGASATQGFLAANASNPQFAQITRRDGPDTEWICYDEFDVNQRQLVRCDPAALELAYAVLTGGRGLGTRDPNEPGQPGGGGPGGGTPGGLGLLAPPSASSSPAAGPAPPVPAPASPPSVPRRAGTTWEPMLGQPQDGTLPITRELAAVFQHRGVQETHAQAHPAGTPVLPVFRARNLGPDGGRPGKNDAAFLMDASPSHLGWPVLVHRGHVPSSQVLAHRWQQVDPASPVATGAGESYAVPVAGANQGEILIALSERVPQPMTAGTVAGGVGNELDTRFLTRLVLWPSGERPRIATDVALGGAARPGGNQPGAVMAAVIDEVAFADTQFGRSFPGVDPETSQGASLVLREALAVGGQVLEVQPRSLRMPYGSLGSSRDFLDDLPQDAGLLRIGDEILAYEQLDAQAGRITVAAAGRGLLGSEPQPHRIGEPVHLLAYLPVSVLTAGVDPSSAVLQLADTAEFPSEGLVLIGNHGSGSVELLHYTRREGSNLAMPIRSREAGQMDQQGPGLFRGRFGTQPGAWGAGQPVVSFPFRYWDRWTDRADAPELGYFGFELAQSGAWWRSTFFEEERAGSGRVTLEALVRFDERVPWDADPAEVDALVRLERGLAEGAPIPLGIQSDRPEWRVHVRYLPGAYDAQTALSHDWRTTPRLRSLGAFYLAPEQVLRSVER